METQNITLAIPIELLHDAKALAATRRVSMSALMKSLLAEAVNKDRRYAAAQKRQLALMEEGIDLGIGESIPWSREELHERR